MKFFFTLLTLAASVSLHAEAMQRVFPYDNYENASIVAKVDFIQAHHPILGSDSVDLKILETWKGQLPNNFDNLKLIGRACNDAPSPGIYIIFLNEEDLENGIPCSSLKMQQIHAGLSKEKFLKYAKRKI